MRPAGRAGQLIMKHLKSLVYLSLFASAAVACDVKQDLGDTASSSASGSGSGTTSGGAETGDSGVVTSGPSETDSGSDTTSGGDTGVLDSGPWWDTSSGTGEALPPCNVSDARVRWNSSGMSPEALGYNTAFAAVGTCTHAVEPFVDEAVTLALVCTLTGGRDGVSFEDEVIEVDLDFEIEGGDETLLPGFADTLTARFYVGSPGFGQGTDRYVVLEQPMLMGGENAPVLFAGQGFTLEPNILDIEDLFDTAWYNGPTLTVADATCETGEAPECGMDVAVRADWGGDSVELHGNQSGDFGLVPDLVPYDLYVESAWEAPNAVECGEDFPNADFRFVGFAT